MSVPFPAFYWVEENRLLAGPYPGDQMELTGRNRLRSLIRAGIRSWIDLTASGELVPYEPWLRDEAEQYNVVIQYQRMAIPDFSVPEPAHMQTILNRIDAEMEAGRPVYIHCWGGVGRTGTTVGCYLVRKGWDASAALNRITELFSQPSRGHRSSPETEEQREFIRQWKEMDQ